MVGKVDKVDNLEKPCHGSFVMPTIVEKRGRKVKLPSNEQALVDEFTGVIRKHRDEDPTTLARLLNVAFDHSLGPGESREIKLARAAVRGPEAAQQITDSRVVSLAPS